MLRRTNGDRGRWAMVIYEVSLEVDADIMAVWLSWLDGHVTAMLALPGFVDAQRERLLEPAPPPGRVGFIVRYRLHDLAALEAYLQHHAAAMRADAVGRFGDRFSAARRISAPDHAGPR